VIALQAAVEISLVGMEEEVVPVVAVEPEDTAVILVGLLSGFLLSAAKHLQLKTLQFPAGPEEMVDLEGQVALEVLAGQGEMEAFVPVVVCALAPPVKGEMVVTEVMVVAVAAEQVDPQSVFTLIMSREALITRMPLSTMPLLAAAPEQEDMEEYLTETMAAAVRTEYWHHAAIIRFSLPRIFSWNTFTTFLCHFQLKWASRFLLFMS
jgi:hypothetical protein